MDEDALCQEELLQAWIDMSMRIRGNRLVSGFSFNEIIICRMLYQQQTQGGTPLTATDLCRRMQLLKSQVNKLLTNLERNGMIQRVRSERDRRKMEIRLRPGGEEAYLTAHKRIVKIMSYVIARLGRDDAQRLTALLGGAVQAIDQMPIIE